MLGLMLLRAFEYTAEVLVSIGSTAECLPFVGSAVTVRLTPMNACLRPSRPVILRKRRTQLSTMTRNHTTCNLVELANQLTCDGNRVNVSVRYNDASPFFIFQDE